MEWWKEGEGTRQRTCMNDPCTWTTEWVLTVGAGVKLGRGGQRGKNRDDYNRINKHFKKLLAGAERSRPVQHKADTKQTSVEPSRAGAWLVRGLAPGLPVPMAASQA